MALAAQLRKDIETRLGQVEALLQQLRKCRRPTAAQAVQQDLLLREQRLRKQQLRRNRL